MEIKKIECGCNCYLLTEGDNSILIDAGMGNPKLIEEECKGKKVTLLILTHGHVDHIKNAKYLGGKLNVPIAMAEEDIPMITNNLCKKMYSKGLYAGAFRFFSEQSARIMKVNPFSVDIRLEDGMSLEPYGIFGKVISLKGHTAGSVGILTRDAFFVGDALMHMKRAGMTLMYQDEKDMIESTKKISDVKDVQIYFGHGDPVSNRNWINL